MAGGVAGVCAMYSLVRLWVGPTLGSRDFGESVRFTVYSGLQVLRIVLCLYLCRLNWSLAEVIAATAGGSDANMQRWSQLQLRIVRLIILLMVVSLAAYAWDWYCRGITIQRLLDLHDLR